jgi:hypothetical protein
MKRNRMKKGACFSKDEMAWAMNKLIVMGSIQSRRSLMNRLMA